jgi:hypothetical protein
MKLNKVHQELKELYKDKEQIDIILSFEFENKNEIERCMNIFRSGYWSVAPFAFEDYNNFAIKLTPNKELLNSQIVAKSKIDFWTISPNMKCFITMSWLRFLNDIDVINGEIKKNWQLLEELSLPFREYTKDLKSLEFLKAYLNEKDNLKYLENSGEYYTKVYLDFWNFHNDSPKQKEYTKLIQTMMEDKSYLPDFEIKDYGVWNTKAYNSLTRRAYSYDLFNLSEEKKADFYWEGFIQSHGFDAASYLTEILPQTSESSDSQLITTIGFANSNRIYQFPKEMQNHPLFLPLERIIKSSKSYNGDAHIEAAKRIDNELGNPAMAWNALVSAGYWSGVNFKEPNIDAWKAAIDLSEKHGWREINEVLIDQLEFYNHYKDKV